MKKDDIEENSNDEDNLDWTDEELRAVFRKVDVDNSGVISRIVILLKQTKYILLKIFILGVEDGLKIYQ